MEFNPRMTVAPDDELQLSAAEVRAILAERATKLARSYAQTSESVDRDVQLIAFGRGDHRYGVELRHLTEIRPLVDLTFVPGLPSFYAGVIQLRGEIVAVMDIAALFGDATVGAPVEPFAVVVTAGDVSS